MSNPSQWRRNLRLPNYDYASAGTYYVTACIQNRACVLGEIAQGEIELSPTGRMIETHLHMAIDRYAGYQLDVHAVMPNHVHALINVGWSEAFEPSTKDVSEDSHGVVLDGRHGVVPEGRHGGLQLRGDASQQEDVDTVSVSRMMQWFKSATTNEYIRRVKTECWPRFPGRLWQQNFYEHVVRDQSDLDRIRTYIIGNPGKWEEDEEYSPFCRGFE